MKLLIVDDSKMIQLVARKMISENNIKVEIYSAYSGEEAIDDYDIKEFDIVILDIIMPGISGIDVLKKLRDRHLNEDVKIIMLTSISDKALIKDSFHLGAFDYITKPIEEDEFVARIQNAIHQRMLERKLSESVKMMKAQNEELKNTQIQLVQKEQMASMGHLAAGVAHEINNPLGFIISNFDVIKDYIKRFENYIDYLETYSDRPVQACDNREKTKDHERLEKDLEFIRKDLIELYSDMDDGLNRVRRIVEGLRSFSRVDQLEAYEDYNLNEGIETLIVLTRNEIDGYANLDIELDANIPTTRAIGYHINQTLLNILMNAIESIKVKFENETGSGIVKIRTFHDAQYVGCTIWDNGLGIAQRELSNIFKPFYSQSKKKMGVGLGLSISYDIIVNKHNGVFDVRSEEGIYAEFTVKVPLISKETP